MWQSAVCEKNERNVCEIMQRDCLTAPQLYQAPTKPQHFIRAIKSPPKTNRGVSARACEVLLLRAAVEPVQAQCVEFKSRKERKREQSVNSPYIVHRGLLVVLTQKRRKPSSYTCKCCMHAAHTPAEMWVYMHFCVCVYVCVCAQGKRHI